MDILHSLPWQSRHSGATDAPCLNEMSSQQSESGQWHHDSLMRWDALALASLSDWDAMHAGAAFCDEMQSTSCPTTSDRSMHAWATGNQVAASSLDASSRFSLDWDYDSSTVASSSVKISPSCFEEPNSDQLSVAEETRGYFDCTTTEVAPSGPGEDHLCQGWNMRPTSSLELPDDPPFALGRTPPARPWFAAPNSHCRVDLSSPAASPENLARPYSESTPTEVPQDSQREEKFEASRQEAGVQSQCERYKARGYERAAPYRAWPKRTTSSACQKGDAPRRRRKGRPTAKEIMERNRLAANNSRLQQRNREEHLTVQVCDAEDLNRELHTIFTDLTNEVLELKMQVLQHAGCKSDLIQGYINQAADSHVRAIQNNRQYPANHMRC